ncbi:MAG TPA: DUF362 domain-containing protein [Bacteroidales bacterium]|nr:DUF362 domain-containing protein [Bacteroidales bacterium]
MPSKVFFTDLHSTASNNLLKKLNTLVTRAGIDTIDVEKKLVAIKIHFGEPGNLAYLRPNFAAVIIRMLRKKEAIPFLTDCNTLYSGRRSNGPNHLEAAFENGYNPLTTGCPVIIADGIKGTEYREVEINKELCASAKIGSAIADSDVIISMNHFKGHEISGFGGALKNLGMGCASVGGKLFLHSGESPEIFEENCTGCRICERSCAHQAVMVGDDRKAHIDYVRCIGCGQCIAVCQYDAARPSSDSSSEVVNRRIAEYAYAAIRDKPDFHINFIMDVSPNCDCWNFNDFPLVPNIGMAASFDPVALDMACVDLVKAAPALPGSSIHSGGNSLEGHDKFHTMHPQTNWMAGLEHAEKIGLGTREYEIVKI